MKINEILETASAGGTSAGAVASVNTTNKKKKQQQKNKDGTVKNALDSDNILAGKTVKR